MQREDNMDASLVVRSDQKHCERFDPYCRRDPRSKDNDAASSEYPGRGDIDTLIQTRGGFYFDPPLQLFPNTEEKAAVHEEIAHLRHDELQNSAYAELDAKPSPEALLAPPLTLTTHQTAQPIGIHPSRQKMLMHYPELDVCTTSRETLHTRAPFVPTGENCVPLHHRQLNKPFKSELSEEFKKFESSEEVKKATLPEINEDLRKARQRLQSVHTSDLEGIARLLKEHDRLLGEKLTLENQAGTGKVVPGLQFDADTELTTRLASLHKLNTLGQVENILSSINKSRRCAAAQGDTEKIRRLIAMRHRTLEYYHELCEQIKPGYKRLSESAPTVQRTTELVRPKESHMRGLDLPCGVSVVPMQRDSNLEPQDTNEVMANLVTQVGRFIRTVNDIQRSIGSQKKSGAAEGLGIALLANVQELFDRTKSLTGEPANREMRVQEVVVVQQREMENNGFPQYIEEWDSDAGDVR